MGREVKRVPMDFDWPLEKTWEGFLNPHYEQCPDCSCGNTESSRALEHLVHLILIAGADSLKGNLHPWLREAGLDSVGTTLHELTTGLANRSPGGFGHDACDRWSAQKKIAAAAGLPDDWGICTTCKGHAIHPDHFAAYEAWESEPPPSGEGWQLWETVSEGSPVSPVFATAEELAQHLADGGGRPLGAPPTYEQALAFVNDGWAPSMISSPDHGLESGVTAVGRMSGSNT